MKKKNYLNFFLLFVILSQETGALYNRTEESSDLLVRRKRLIDRSRNGNRPVTRIQDVPYIVSVYELEEFSCSGNIILVNVIITTAVCVFNGNIPEIYSVRSGSAYRQAGNPHRVLKIRHHPELSTNQMNGDIALLTINPPIDRRVNTPIPLYIGQIPPHTLATVSGWGHTNIRRVIHPVELRSIIVPTISLEECRRELRNTQNREFVTQLSNKVICTYDKFLERHASILDDGNPLVVHNHLAGILFWTEQNGYPDVYVNLEYPEYKAWINRMLGQIASNPP